MSNAQDFVTSFMKNLAGEGVELTPSLQAVFAKILAEQVVVDADTNVVSFKPVFSTLLKVLTFIATPEDKRPEAGSDYTQEAYDAAADSAATKHGLELGGDAPVDPELPTDEPTEEPTDGPTDEPTEEPGIEGNTLELTTGADVIAPLAEGEEAVEGLQYTTENDDVINGLAGSYATATLNKDDQIDGGAGNDTLNVELTSKFGGFTGDGFLKNVETVNLTNTGTSSRVFDAKQVEGVETYNLDGMVDLNALNSADIAVNVANRDSGVVSIGYASTVADGSDDTLNLGITNLGTAKTAKDAVKEVTVNADGIENLNLTAAGANFVKLGSMSTLENITVAGAGSLDLNGLGAKVEAIDASALAGNLNLDLAGTTGVTLVKGGAGDDVITATANNLKVNSTIDGGAGQDTLVLKDNKTATLQLDMVGVETLKLQDNATALTYSAAKTAGLENLVIAGTSASGSGATFAGMEGDLNVTLENASGNATYSSDHDGATTLKVSSTKETAFSGDTSVSFSKSVNLDATVDEFVNYTGTISAGAAEAANLTLNGSVTSAAKLELGAAQSLVINDNNKAADTLVLDAANLEELTVNVANASAAAAGDFALASGSKVAGLKSLNVTTEGKFDASSGGGMTNIADITLTGMGAVVLGDLGSTTSEESITLTAVGLAGVSGVSGVDGLKTGGINTAAGYNVDINIAEVLGSVDLASSGGITVESDSNGKTGSITITAEGTAGAIKLGKLTAKTVTIDAGDALGTIGGSGSAAVVITADEVSFTGSSIAANNVDVTAAKATIVGSLVADTIKVTGVVNAAETVVELTGGLGADTFTISGGASHSSSFGTMVSSEANAAQKMLVTITDFEAGKDSIASFSASITSLTGTTIIKGSTAALKDSNGSINSSALNTSGANLGKIEFVSATAASDFFATFKAFDSTLNLTVENTQFAAVDINGSSASGFVAGILHNNDFYTYNKAASNGDAVLIKLVGVDTAETVYDFAVSA